MKDESTYGFNKADASALLAQIGIRDELTPTRGLQRRRGAIGSFVEEVRWVDPVLEYRKGTTWTNIDTAVSCSTMSPLATGLGS